ncbi:MAG: hypothetical protein RLZZ182_1503 [Pseudomonadota bacterium]|jgi:hypothetical protein
MRKRHALLWVKAWLAFMSAGFVCALLYVATGRGIWSIAFAFAAGVGIIRMTLSAIACIGEDE